MKGEENEMLDLTPKEAEKYDIGKTQLYRMKKSIESKTYNLRKKTLYKLVKLLKS